MTFLASLEKQSLQELWHNLTRKAVMFFGKAQRACIICLSPCHVGWGEAEFFCGHAWQTEFRTLFSTHATATSLL